MLSISPRPVRKIIGLSASTTWLIAGLLAIPLCAAPVLADGESTLVGTELNPFDLGAEEPSLSNDGIPTRDESTSAPGLADLGALTFYSDLASFETAFPGLPVEDFEAGAVAPGDFIACPAPLSPAGAGACFAPGAILDGLSFQDVPGPDTTDGLLVIGDGAFGNGSIVLSNNAFADALEISFAEPVEAVAVDLLNLPGPSDTLDVEVYGAGDQLLANFSAASSATGELLAFSSPDPVSRILLSSSINEVEGIDNLQFGVTPSLTLSAVAVADSCGIDPTADNGTSEPGEVIDLILDLTAGGADLTGLEGVLTTADPDLVLLDDSATWPDISRGSTASQLESLSFLINGSLCGLAADLTLTVSADQGIFTLPVTVDVGAPQEPLVPIPIPDGLIVAAVSTLEVATEVTVSGLQVEVEVDHTWVGDLTLLLESPSGTEVTLMDRPGVPASTQGCFNNDLRVTFADGAAVDPETSCNPSTVDPFVTGSVLPAEALAAFDGEPADGTWTLTVRDSLVGDLGVLNNWRLINDSPIGPPCETCELSSDLAMGLSCVGEPDPFCVLEVSNLGNSPALDLQVLQTLPVEVQWVSDSCGAGPAVGQVLTWNLASLGADDFATCTIELMAPSSIPDDLVSTAAVSSTVTDPDLTNNSATTVFQIGTVLNVPGLNHLGVFLLSLFLIAAAFHRLSRLKV